MQITNCTFMPAEHEADLVDVEITFDGIITVVATIYREHNAYLMRSSYIVKWPDDAYFKNSYLEKYFNACVLDWYYEWKDEKSMI